MKGRRFPLAFALALTLAGAPLGQLGQHVHAQQELPPVSYICPMDPDVLEDKPGTCPICKMDLEPARLDLAYFCLTHQQQTLRDTPGTCPFDKRELVQVIVAVHWQCGDAPNPRLMDPGKCGDGTDRKKIRTIRAHGDHNPRHGGQFFMAADKWHHLEGTYPQDGLFRVFFYDNFTKAIDSKDITGRAIVRDAAGKDLASYDLRPSRDGKTLEASIKNAAALSKESPLRIAAKLKFKKETAEQQFDFTFAEVSKEPPPGSVPPTAIPKPVQPTTTAAVRQAPPAPKPQATPAPAAQAPTPVVQPPPAPAQPPAAPPPPPAPDPAPSAQAPAPSTPAAGSSLELMPSTIIPEEVLPGTLPELLALLDQRGQEAEQLIKDGVFAQVYIPAMSGKNIALALENFVGSLPNRQRVQASAALRRAVLAAWKLDMAGDIGNRDDLMAAYTLFANAVTDIKAAYGNVR